MIKSFFIATFLVFGCFFSYSESYLCPDDSCELTWTGRTDFCVGINCRTVKIYRCGCCAKEWRVYQN
jgi:hypothetical protein